MLGGQNSGMKLGEGEISGHRWVDDPPHDSVLRSTTAEQALADLPPIQALDLLGDGKLRRGRKDPSERVEYVGGPSTDWSRLMRNWPGFETEGFTTGHVFRYLPRDYKFFRIMKPGWQYPEIWREVERTRERLLRAMDESGLPAEERAIQKLKIEQEWELPYDPDKFPNKWWKLYPDRPVRTLMAHLGKDGYSHVHFDEMQARTISVREAARLQSFPDGFLFSGSMNPAFKQIGNAVAPLMAYALAMGIRKCLGLRDIPDIRVERLGVPKRLIRYKQGRK